MNITMDVTTISGASAFQQQTIAQNVQSSVAAKSLQVQKTQGAAVLQLLQSATEPTNSSSSTNAVDVRA